MTSPLGQDQDVSRSRPITTAEAAAIADMTIAAFRKAMQRLRLKGHGDYRLPETEWFPGSNPAWDERAIRKWAAGRLGRAEKKDTDQ
jgi:hypothetical protein